MKVEVTEKAYKALLDKGAALDKNYIFLKYDIDGCGCVVSGVSLLHEKEDLEDGEVLAEMIHTESHIKVSYEKQYDWVYDDKLTVEYNDGSGTFQLKSPNQMLNPRMNFFPKK